MPAFDFGCASFLIYVGFGAVVGIIETPRVLLVGTRTHACNVPLSISLSLLPLALSSLADNADADDARNLG